MTKHPAYWTFDEVALKHGFRLYYFAPVDRRPPPYRKQIRVTAIVDIADDGSLAGIELIADAMPLPPHLTTSTSSVSRGESE